MQQELTFGSLMGDATGALALALEAGRDYLAGATQGELLASVGKVIAAVPPAPWPDKRWFQRSYGRQVTDAPDDLAVGRGLFYLTEQRRLFLDCTAGHYQMTWGYDHPELRALLRDGIARGIVPDNHSNIPPAPVKRLAARLVELANPGADPAALQGDDRRLNTVLLGLCTGTVACAAALKMMLLHYRAAKPRLGAPAFITLEGNYHGTDLFAQRLRGMWPEYFANVTSVQVEPNDHQALAAAFREHGERVAGFIAEPILMNREAIALDADYLQLARSLCDQTGALLGIDEIQTGFWFPRVFCSLHLGVEPDFLVLGKGMAAGYHPLSAVVYRGCLDRLEQYDAISTNGNAGLAAYLALGCLALVEREADRIGRVGKAYHERMAGLCAEFPDLLAEVRGVGHLTGLKFRRVEDALGFHRAAVTRGLWVRAHAYHPGHSTLLTKLALTLDEEVTDYTIGAAADLLRTRPWA